MQEAYNLGYTPPRLLSLFIILASNGAPPSRLLAVATAPDGVRDRGVLAEIENDLRARGATGDVRPAAKALLLREIRRRFRAAGVPELGWLSTA